MLAAQNSDNSNPAPESNGLSITIAVSKDRMQASLSGELKTQTPPDEVKKILVNLIGQYRIKNGIDTAAVRQAIERLSQGQAVGNLIFATGSSPQPGRDASIEVLAKAGVYKPCELMASGEKACTFGNQPGQVQEGELLAKVIPPAQGQPGLDVFGNRVSPAEARHIRLQPSEGVELSPNRMEAYAGREGILLQPEFDRFDVVAYQEIEGDVDPDSGPVVFPGIVKVKGGIRRGMKVRCRGLLTQEVEPEALLEIDGDLIVEGGIMGAVVKVFGGIIARYLRDCHISLGGDLVLENEIVGSSIVCQGKVRLTMPEGRIVNSEIAALTGIECALVLSSGSDRSSLRFGMTEEYEKEYHGLRRNFRDLQGKQQVIGRQIQDTEVELYNTETELKGLLNALKDPEKAANKDNLMGQLGMIKPLRDSLKEELETNKHILKENFYKLNRLALKLDQMRRKVQAERACLKVSKQAEASAELIGPMASLVLKKNKKAFVAKEYMVLDNSSGERVPQIKCIAL